MKSLFKICIVAAAICIFSIHSANAAVMIADDLYLAENVTGLSGNVAFLVTPEGVVVVDSGASCVNAVQIQAEVKSVTTQPIRFLILTHSHFDHTFGAAHFPDGATVIGHKNFEPNLRFFMQNGYYYFLEKLIPGQVSRLNNQVKELDSENGVGLEAAKQALKEAIAQLEAFKDVKIIYPNVLLEDKLSLKLGGQSVDIIFPGKAHTDDNLVVVFPNQKVMHVGDLVFNNAFPYIISGKGGSDTANWINIAHDLTKWDISTIIPGHGIIGSKEILNKQMQFLTDLRNAVTLSIKQGQSLEQAKQSIRLSQYDSYAFKDILPMDIEAVYMELTASKKHDRK